MNPPLARLIPLFGFLIFLSGCNYLPTTSDHGPVYTPTNVRGPATWPIELRRVAILPAHDASGTLPANFASSYDPIWRRTLDRSQRAEFITLTRSQLSIWTGRETLASTALLPPNFLGRIARETDAQAVLFLDLNHCTAYPPLVLSFRARLVDITTGETLWMADEIFDASSAPTARAARHYARSNTTSAGDATSGVLQSPSRFAEYAFLAVAELLPPRIDSLSKKN